MKKYQIIKYIVGAVAIIIVFPLSLVSCDSQKPVLNTNPETLAGIQRGDAPWPPETSSSKKGLKEIGLPVLTREGAVLHTHEHLDIFVAGRQVPVPSDIGIGNAAGFIAPIHTHDETGIIHVESPTSRTFDPGQFLDIQGVLFTKDCIGGYCGQGDKSLEVFVNGNMFQGDPRTIEVDTHGQARGTS